jgi:hypothetical protein
LSHHIQTAWQSKALAHVLLVLISFLPLDTEAKAGSVAKTTMERGTGTVAMIKNCKESALQNMKDFGPQEIANTIHITAKQK